MMARTSFSEECQQLHLTRSRCCHETQNPTIIRLKLSNAVGDALLSPILSDVKCHERRRPEVAAVEVDKANVFSDLAETLSDAELVRYADGIAADHDATGVLAHLGVFLQDESLSRDLASALSWAA
jgi:hypothetical protein